MTSLGDSVDDLNCQLILHEAFSTRILHGLFLFMFRLLLKNFETIPYLAVPYRVPYHIHWPGGEGGPTLQFYNSAAVTACCPAAAAAAAFPLCGLSAGLLYLPVLHLAM
jgi:hypothetical protein